MSDSAGLNPSGDLPANRADADRAAAELFGEPVSLEQSVPLREYARGLNAHSIVGIFTAICDLVDDQHRNLKLPRSLDPSGVLIVQSGMPRIPSLDDTRLLANPQGGKVTMTLAAEYASPEQLEGGTMTTASNVYSIGVMLYECLAGRPPWGRQVVAIDGKPLKLSPREPDAMYAAMEFPHQGTPPEGFARRRTALRSDLHGVAMKAIAAAPGDRYQTVREFGDDLRNYLGFRPVSTQASTWQYRTGKFLQRNGTIVLTSSAIAFLLMIALGLAFWQTSRLRAEDRRTSLAFDAVRGLPTVLLNDVFDQLDRLPGTQAAQSQLAEAAVRHLDELARNSDYRADIRAELVAAYTRAASIQGDPYRANLGDYKAAEESARKAMTIAADLRRKLPDNESIERQDALARRALGAALSGQDRNKDAVRYLTEASEIFERMAFREKPAARDAIEAAISNDLLGDVTARNSTQRQSGFEDEATGFYQKAAKLYERALQIEPGNTDSMAGIVTEMSKVAAFYRQSDPLASIPHFERAIQRQQRLPESRRTSVAGLREEAALSGGLGRALESVGRRNEAAAPLERALDLRRLLARQDVKNPLAKSDLQAALHDRAVTMQNAGKRAEALALFLEEAELIENLLKSAGSAWNEQYVEVLFRVSEIQNANQEIEAAAVSGRKALEGLRKFVKNPDLTPAQLSTAIERAIRVQPVRLQDPELALTLARRLENGGASGPEQWYAIGQAHSINGRNTEARAAMLQALTQINAARGDRAKLRQEIQESLLAIR